jgi:hypothetical protein
MRGVRIIVASSEKKSKIGYVGYFLVTVGLRNFQNIVDFECES